MLRIALPNKGSLAKAASTMLQEAGYRQRRNEKDLVLLDREHGVEFFYLRPRDIAVYVGEGTLDIGITGRDLLHDSQANAEEILALDFGKSTFHFAAPIGQMKSSADLANKRIATSYKGIVKQYLDSKGISASVVRLDGAVESSIRLGVADAIADVVETGSTLRQADLEVFGDPIMESEAILITRKGAQPPEGLDVFIRRLQGVMLARNYVMMDYDIAAENLDVAVDLTPGIESPTVSPLHRDGWYAVRAMVPREDTQRIMDALFEVGGRGILVTDILACRI